MKEFLMQFVSVVSVPVSDQERGKRFYAEQPGLEVVAEASFGDEMQRNRISLRQAGS
jgi:catechol 2,3-dioxygenase-like lactoylglutathione lyase family enzyme